MHAHHNDMQCALTHCGTKHMQMTQHDAWTANERQADADLTSQNVLYIVHNSRHQADS